MRRKRRYALSRRYALGRVLERAFCSPSRISAVALSSAGSCSRSAPLLRCTADWDDCLDAFVDSDPEPPGCQWQLSSFVVVRIEEQLALHLSLKNPSVSFAGSTQREHGVDRDAQPAAGDIGEQRRVRFGSLSRCEK